MRLAARDRDEGVPCLRGAFRPGTRTVLCAGWRSIIVGGCVPAWLATSGETHVLGTCQGLAGSDWGGHERVRTQRRTL